MVECCQPPELSTDIETNILSKPGSSIPTLVIGLALQFGEQICIDGVTLKQKNLNVIGCNAKS